MIHILLTTLKVIGILLAITLGLIVGLILIVLFVPIRYNANVNNIDVKAKVTWLLHLLSVRLEFIDKRVKYKIKILGITILNSSLTEPTPSSLADSSTSTGIRANALENKIKFPVKPTQKV